MQLQREMAQFNYKAVLAQALSQAVLVGLQQALAGGPLTAILAPALIAAMTALVVGLIKPPSFASGRMFDSRTSLPPGTVVGDGRDAGAPVDMEALLNAAQLAEFGTRFSEQQRQREQVQQLNATIVIQNDVELKNNQIGLANYRDEVRKKILRLE